LNELLWDILESEAPYKFFVDERKDPAFLLIPKWHYLSLGGWELYLNHVGRICRLRSRQQALDRLREIIENANVPVKVYSVSGKRRTLFAENEITRISLEKATEPITFRVFNIDEWGGY